MKFFVVVCVWLISLPTIFFTGPVIGGWIVEHIPYSFLILAPFGLSSFFEWVSIAAISYFAAHALRWDDPPVRKMAKWLLIGSIGVVLLHVAWVTFVVAKGGL